MAARALHVARSLAEASSLAAKGGPSSLILKGGEDLVCRNLMCESVGEPCICRLSLVLSRCKNLTTLDLSSSNLTALPDTLFDARGLVSLDVSSNKLKSLPSSIEKLSQLKKLHVDGNPLSRLPPQLGGMKALEVLVLHEGQIASEGILSLQQRLPTLRIDVVALTG